MGVIDSGVPMDKAALERRIDASRATLEALFEMHDEAQLLAATDDAGWSARDHFHHLAAWEEFEILRERGPEAYAVFGLPDKASYDVLLAQEPDFRAINEHIRRHGQALTLAEVRAYARRARVEAKALLATFSEAALLSPSKPDDPASVTFMAIVAGNSYEHDDEHRRYIKTLLARGTHSASAAEKIEERG